MKLSTTFVLSCLQCFFYSLGSILVFFLFFFKSSNSPLYNLLVPPLNFWRTANNLFRSTFTLQLKKTLIAAASRQSSKLQNFPSNWNSKTFADSLWEMERKRERKKYHLGDKSYFSNTYNKYFFVNIREKCVTKWSKIFKEIFYITRTLWWPCRHENDFLHKNTK